MEAMEAVGAGRLDHHQTTPARGNCVRAIREERLMTREELAERAGVSTRTVWSVEAGYPCRLVTKRRLVKALGVARRDHRRVFPNG